MRENDRGREKKKEEEKKVAFHQLNFLVNWTLESTSSTGRSSSFVSG